MEEIIKKLKQLNAKRVFIQFPEGIKLKIQDIAMQLEKEGFDIIICAEPCYGACDIREHEARLLNCDTILHIGHEDFGIKISMPVVFWEYFIDVNPLPILEKEFNKLQKYDKIGLVTSIQFVKTIPVIKNYLENKGKKVFIHKSLQYEGQVLGCKLDAALAIEDKVDCFLCISAGKFYGLGLMMLTEKPIFNLDLEKKEIHTLDEEKKKTQKIIAWNLSRFKEAKKVGVLLSWKLGQLKLPFEIKKKLEAKGKEVYILAMDEITPEKLEGLKLDVCINCACHRIGIDDLERYKIPMVNLQNLEKLDI